MAFVLTSVNLTNGLENQAAQALLSLKHFATLTPPVTEAVMRADLETSQPVGFISDAGWLAFVGVLTALSIDDTALVAAERSIINTLRTIVSPPPSQACCTTSGVVPSNGDLLSSIVGYPRTGSATFEHEIEMTLSGTYTCDIVEVDIALVPIGAAPAITSANPFTVNFKACSTAGDSLYSFLWFTTATDPATESYDITYTYKDATGATVATYVPTYTLNL